MKKVLLFCAVVGIAGLAVQARAAEQAAKEETHELESIGTKAKRIGEPVASPYAVPESSKLQTEVYTREDIEAINPETVWDVIKQAPGMEVTFQGRQHMDFANMRGGSYGIILDGVYITQADRLLASLPVDSIESVTIIRDATVLTLGPLSNFGSSNGSPNHGFIVIKTRRSSKPEVGLVGAYGSFNTHRENLSAGEKRGNFDYRLSYENKGTDGKSGWNMASRNDSLLFRGGFTSSFLNADLLWYKSWGMREMEWGLVLIPTTLKDGTQDWSKVGTLSESTMNMNKLNSDLVALNVEIPWSKTQTTTVQYAFNYLGIQVTEKDQNSSGHNVSLRHTANWGDNILKLGGQFLSYDSPGVAPTNKRDDEQMYGAFITDEYHLFNNRLSVDAGFRMDKKHYDSSPVTGQDFSMWAKETYAYTIGTALKLTSLLTLTGRYSYTENPPSTGYQISPDGSPLPSERQSRYELGVLAAVHPAFTPWATLYYYDTQNEKVSAKGTDPFTGQKNVSSYIDPNTGEEIDFVTTAAVATKGFETGISGEFLKYFNYRIQYTYITTNNDTKNEDISHHFISALLGARYKNLFANMNIRYVGPKSRSSSPAGVFYYELGDYTKVDLNMGYQGKIFDRNTRITVYTRNLLNDYYATRYVTGAYRDPGFQCGVELAFSFL
jgi:iron complex outermembrane receptor protein